MSRCRLYLISPPHIGDLAAFAEALGPALEAGDVAAFQLRLKGGEEPETGAPAPPDVTDVRTAAAMLFPIVQGYGAAALLNDDPALAAELGADGVHIGQDDAPYADARAALGEGGIVGVTCHASRHLAMEAAEHGADYVAFGAFFPTPTKAPPAQADPEILAWWSELFTIPCVAIGGVSVNTAPGLAQAGADFVAVSAGVWGSPEGPTAACAAFRNALDTA